MRASRIGLLEVANLQRRPALARMLLPHLDGRLHRAVDLHADCRVSCPEHKGTGEPQPSSLLMMPLHYG